MGKGGESKTKNGALKKGQAQSIAAPKIDITGNGQIYQLANLDDEELRR